MDVWVADMDSKSKIRTVLYKILASYEKTNKAKYSEPCLAQRLQFTPFVVAIYGMVGVEAVTLVYSMTLKLSYVWLGTYSRVYGYLK